MKPFKNLINRPKNSWIALGVSAAFISLPVQAEVSAKDIQIIGRVLSFTDPPHQGTVTVGIVHDEQSKALAESLTKSMGAGLTTGSVTLVPKMMVSNEVSSGDTKVLLLLDPSRSGADAMRASSGRGLLIIGTDSACIDAGTCVVSVQSAPKVEITVSQTAAKAAGVAFSAAFRMMVKER